MADKIKVNLFQKLKVKTLNAYLEENNLYVIDKASKKNKVELVTIHLRLKRLVQGELKREQCFKFIHQSRFYLNYIFPF